MIVVVEEVIVVWILGVFGLYFEGFYIVLNCRGVYCEFFVWLMNDWDMKVLLRVVKVFFVLKVMFVLKYVLE